MKRQIVQYFYHRYTYFIENSLRLFYYLNSTVKVRRKNYYSVAIKLEQCFNSQNETKPIFCVENRAY